MHTLSQGAPSYGTRFFPMAEMYSLLWGNSARSVPLKDACEVHFSRSRKLGGGDTQQRNIFQGNNDFDTGLIMICEFWLQQPFLDVLTWGIQRGRGVIT